MDEAGWRNADYFTELDPEIDTAAPEGAFGVIIGFNGGNIFSMRNWIIDYRSPYEPKGTVVSIY